MEISYLQKKYDISNFFPLIILRWPSRRLTGLQSDGKSHDTQDILKRMCVGENYDIVKMFSCDHFVL